MTAQNNIICNGGANGFATVTVVGGVAPYTYAWSPSGGTAATATGLDAGTYTVTVTDANGCTVSQSVTITEPEPLQASISQTNVSCYEAVDGMLGVNVSGGAEPYTYTWTPAVSTGPNAENLTAGNYSVIITDANGCSTLRNFSLTQPDELIVTTTATDAGCNGGNDGSAEATVTGGTAPYSYSWSPSGGDNATATGLIAGTYTVTVTDDHGCSSTSTVTINEPLAISILSQPEDVTITTGLSATYSVDAINVDSYQWQYSEDGNNWMNITDGGANPEYSGATTATLTVVNIPANYNGYVFRAELINGNNCIATSDAAMLTVTNILEAVNDDFSTSPIIEGTAGIAGDVTANDLFNSLPVNDMDIIISITDDGGLTGVTVDNDGNIMIPDTATEGTYTIIYSICDVNNSTNCSTAEVIIVVSALSGTDEFREIKLTLYPNPATTEVFIKIPDFSGYNNLKVAVYDLHGRLVKENHLTSELEGIDVTNLESGVYLFNITSDTGKVTKRVIIDKKAY
ncbi:T9SS type A sorting domain-containing protein [Flavobacterium sp. NRK1]|uniref:T9SS type A sorting domain-containing protein n=1 Tax=Flavobacterium sp. NRK1 TaxID=2954929 RepID=UPI0035AF8F7D